jgi:hypothetical protein
MSIADDIQAEEQRTATRSAIGKLADLLERQGISPDDIGKVQRINAHQGFYKDPDGEAQTVDMVGITFHPKFAEGPEWPVIQQAKPCAPRRVRVAPRFDNGYGMQRAVILPDPQIGFRHHADGTLEPFHDDAAIDVALQIARYVRPHRITNLGDFLDLPEQSTKFRKEAAFARTTQMALDYGHEFLARQREILGPDGVIDLIEGNHDIRIKNYVIDNALAAFGLRQANMPASWPVLSVQHLLRLDELGVNYAEGYPQGIVWYNERLGFIHGFHLKPEKMLADEDASLGHGHTHRIYELSRTKRTSYGRKTTTVWSPGCLCRVDGAVPSTKGATAQDGKVVSSVEDWQQGLAIVDYDQDGNWSHQTVKIDDGRAYYDGRWFEADR